LTGVGWDTAHAKARELLAALTGDEDRALTEAALADLDARPLERERLDRMAPVSAADAANLGRRLRVPGRPPV